MAKRKPNKPAGGKKQTGGKKPAGGRKQTGDGSPDSRELAIVREYALEMLETDDSPIDVLSHVAQDTDNGGADLAWLAAYDFDPDVAMASVALLAGASYYDEHDLLRKEIWSSAEPVVLAALRNRSLSDERKSALAGVCMRFGHTFENHELRQFFHDFDAVVQQSFDDSMKLAAEEPDELELMLHSASLLSTDDEDVPPPDAVFSLLQITMEALDKHPAAAAAIIGASVAIAAEHHLPFDMLAPSLEALRDNASEQAAWTLRELGNLPATGQIGVLARVMAAQVEQGGVVPRPNLRRTFVDGRLSVVDGTGSRHLALAFRTPDDTIDFLQMRISDTDGICEEWVVYDTSETIDELLEDHEDNIEQLDYAKCSLETAREIIADAYAIHEELGKPICGRHFIYRPYLGPEPITAQRRTPDLSAYQLESIEQTPDMAEDSEILIDDITYASLWCSSEDAYEFVALIMLRELGITNWNKGKNAASSAREAVSRLESTIQPDFTDDDITRFILEVAADEREVLLLRLAANLELRAMLGAADEPVQRAAAETWLTISKNVIPFENIPYIRELASLSFQLISMNFSYGFASQKEANEAQLYADDYIDDPLDINDWGMEWDDEK